MSHTPGPWTFRRNFARTGEYEIYSGEQPIAIVLNRADGVHDEEIAILIAAAPDMLKVLQEICEWTERYTATEHPIATVAKRAIAKATGGEA